MKTQNGLLGRIRFRSFESVGVAVLAGIVVSAGCADGPDPWTEDQTLRPNADLLAGGLVRSLSDSVSGDVMLAGRSLEFDGFAGGSYLGAGGDQAVAGTVRGSVRSVGGSIEIDATVGRNLTLAGGRVAVRENAAIGGNAYLAGGSVRIGGTVAGDVYLGAGSVVLDGTIGGDVSVEASSLTIGPDAHIQGELRYRLPEDVEVVVSADAVVAGGLVALEARPGDGGRSWFFILRVLAFVVTAVVVAALFPGTLSDTANALAGQPAAAIGIGLLWVLLVPLAVVIGAVTIIGIPAALILVAVYGLSLSLAPIVPALWLGDVILRGREATDRKTLVLLVTIGGAIVAFVTLRPWVGFLVRVVVTCAGIGGLALAVRRRLSVAEPYER